jgi:hypothetical protein
VRLLPYVHVLSDGGDECVYAELDVRTQLIDGWMYTGGSEQLFKQILLPAGLSGLLCRYRHLCGYGGGLSRAGVLERHDQQ